MLFATLPLRATDTPHVALKPFRALRRSPGLSFHSTLPPVPRQGAGKPLPRSAIYRRKPSFTPSSNPSPSAPPKPPIRKGWFIIVGLFTWSLSSYIFYHYTSYKRILANSPNTPSTPLDVDVSDRFNALAPSYDQDVALSERLMRLETRRKQLISKATGHILEVSCGTGRNVEYFDLQDPGEAALKGKRSRISEIQSITFVDQSPQMLDIARRKFREKWPAYKSARFVLADAEESEKLPPPPVGGYDAVIQTMGLCSTSDPVALLQTLAASCRKPTPDSREGGRLLLLEHGRGYYGWLNKYLDDSAPRRADKYGCWWNRDIEKILAESELEVVKVKRYHFGTTWEVELRPTLRNQGPTGQDRNSKRNS